MPFTRTECIVLTIVPMTTGFLSVISSSTIISMVFRSKKKLGDPYRRIIFGMSSFDLFVSLAFVFKIFKTTPEQPNAWLALGNQTSCNVLGFLHFAGINGALLYNLSLNIYYICLIKYNMKAKFYSNRIEPILHGAPIIWGIVSASIIVGTGHMNPAYVGDCLIAPYPVNCLDKPGVQCIRGMHAHLYRMVFSTLPRFIVLALIIVTLGMLWWTVKAKEMKMDKYRMSMVSFRMQSDADRRSSGVSSRSSLQRMSNNLSSSFQGLRSSLKAKSSQGSADHERRVSLPNARNSRRRSKGRCFLIQAQWYVLAFLLTHGFAVAATIMRKSGITPSIWIYVTARFFSPLQGLFNIVVYTRPHVINERRRRPTSSWWEAFKKVVASGGDDDEDKTNRLRGRIQKSPRASASNGPIRKILRSLSNVVRTKNRADQTATQDDGESKTKPSDAPIGSSILSVPDPPAEVINHEGTRNRRVFFMNKTTGNNGAMSTGISGTNADEDECFFIDTTMSPDVPGRDVESLGAKLPGNATTTPNVNDCNTQSESIPF
jgi:hypothetical protein